MYQIHDAGINHIKARKDRRCYGMGLGIIILDEVYPGFPGDVRNASAYPFPIQYEIVEDVDIPRLVFEEDKFENLWLASKRPDTPLAYYDKAQHEFVNVAVDFYKNHPNMGAMVLECTGFQPFARALQREIDIPVFSWGTLLDYAYAVTVHRDFYGHV